MSWLSQLTACCEPRTDAAMVASNGDMDRKRKPGPRGIPQSTVIQNHTSEQLVGVGLIFESTRPGDSGLVVSSVPTGGPAYDSGQIEIGDELIAVNDTNVEQLDPSRIAPYILGPPGSQVKLGLRSDSKGFKEVILTRRYAMKLPAGVTSGASLASIS